MTWGNRARIAAAAIAICGTAGSAWVVTHRGNDGSLPPKYPNARSMAFAAGCTDTFHALPLVEGVQSQGECTVSGQVIGFRVQRDIDFGDPWPTAPGSDHYLTGVGNGWVVHGTDRATFNAVSARLAP